MSSPTPRSLAWLNGSCPVHIENAKQPDGTYVATTAAFPDHKGTHEDESVAVSLLQQSIREAAQKGVL